MNNISIKVYNHSTTPVETQYLAGYQYISNVLQFFPTAEGYVNNTVVSGINQYSYVYNYTDHLGNIRLSYKKNGTTLQILEENNYYPFGLKHTYYNTTNAQPNYKYKYNSKEYQDELGLNFYDYGARNYDASIGRWMNIDPLAEKMRRHSLYNYAFDNPVYFIDPDGMQASPPNEYELTHDKDGKEVKKEISKLGGNNFDFIHYIDGDKKGTTEVIDKSLSSSVFVPSSILKGYKVRDNTVSWSDITNEFITGKGYEKSLFIETNDDFENCSKTATCKNTHSSIWSLSSFDSKIGYAIRKSKEDTKWFDWGVTDALTTDDMWHQMIGSSWTSRYEFSTGLIMYVVQDTKNLNSLLYHIPGKENNIPR